MLFFKIQHLNNSMQQSYFVKCKINEGLKEFCRIQTQPHLCRLTIMYILIHVLKQISSDFREHTNSILFVSGTSYFLGCVSLQRHFYKNVCPFFDFSEAK